MSTGRPPTVDGPSGASSAPQGTWADQIRLMIQEALTNALADAQPELEQLAKATGAGAGPGLTGDVGSLVDLLTTAVIVALGITDPEIGLPMAALAAADGEAGKLGSGFGLGYLLGSVGFQAMQPLLLPLFHAINDASQNEIFDPSTAAQLAARGVISDSFANSEGGGGGMDAGHMASLIEAAHTWPGLAELLELVRRGDASASQATEALQRAGVHPEWIPRLLYLQRILLSPADLALTVLRGFMTQEQGAAYAARLGVDAADFQTLINNTGEPPATQELLQAYRRGIIDQTRLVHGIVESRVRPEWIDVIEQLRYAPMSTSDAARAVVQNYLDEPTGAQIAQQNGLKPGHWTPLLEAYGRPLSHEQMMQLYFRGLVTQGQVTQAFKESDLKDKYTTQAFELGRRLIPIRQVGQVILHGIEPPSWGINMLMMQGYTHQDAATLVQIETEGKAAVHKELAQGMILEMYEAKAITHDEAVADLGQLGWTPDQADFILATKDAQVALAEQRKAITAIRRAYLASRIDETTARNQLVTIHVLQNQQDVLLTDWQIELEGRVQELTATDIADAVRYGGLSYQRGLDKLVAAGYTPEDAAIFLAAHEALPPPPPVTTAPPGI